MGLSGRLRTRVTTYFVACPADASRPQLNGVTERSAPALTWSRWYRPVTFGLAAVLLFGAAVEMYAAATVTFAGEVGLDFGHYLDGTRRWVETGTPYLTHEAAGEFRFGELTFLHPPIALLLFAPFLILPAVAWWAVPLAVVGWSVVSWRPAPWAWPLMALGLAWPRFAGAIVVGNSDLWVWAFFAIGLRLGWPAVLIGIKPSLAPLMLVGIHTQRWWLTAATVALVSLPFGLLWFDWLMVVLNSPGDLAYSIGNVPWLAVPVVAWLARAR